MSDSESMQKRKFNTEKAINTILYIATRLGAPAADMYATLKAIYFADRAHLEGFGRLIYGEAYTAMEYGPVPSAAYDIVKAIAGRAALPVDAPGAADAMTADRNNITPRVQADLSVFSKSELICLEKGIDRVRGKDFGAIRKASHTKAYEKADRNGEMAIEDIVAELKDGGALALHISDRFPGDANKE